MVCKHESGERAECTPACGDGSLLANEGLHGEVFGVYIACAVMFFTR